MPQFLPLGMFTLPAPPALVRSALRRALALRLIISYQASKPGLGQGLGQGMIVPGPALPALLNLKLFNWGLPC